MFNPIIHRRDLATYFRNRKPRDVTLQPTPENRALIAEYEALAKAINEYPARFAGLPYNYRKKELGMAVARLVEERETKVARLLELETILGFTK